MRRIDGHYHQFREHTHPTHSRCHHRCTHPSLATGARETTSIVRAAPCQRKAQVCLLRTTAAKPTATKTRHHTTTISETTTATSKRHRGHPSGRHAKEIHVGLTTHSTCRRETTLDPATATDNTVSSKTGRSRRTKQRHNTKQYRSWQRSLHRQSTAETSIHANSLRRSQALILRSHQQRYKLRLNTNRSSFQNAVTNVANTPAHQFYNHSKLAFHDLTEGKIVPPLAKSVLGLGFKFIRTSPHITGAISATTARLERDF